MNDVTVKIDDAVKGAVRDEQLQSSYKLWKFWAIAAPAYIYFFGYNARYYYMDYLGFDAAEISSDPSSVYHFAFHSLGFVVWNGFKYLAAEFLHQFIEHWLFYLIVTFSVGFVIYFGFLLSKWRRRHKGGDEGWRVFAFFLRVIGFLKRLLNKNHHVKYGFFSFCISVFYFITNLLIAPLVVLILTVVFLVFSPSVFVGNGMAKYEKEHFNCDLTEKDQNSVPPCNTLILSDSTIRVGKIFHRDTQYIYLYTEYGPLTVSVESVKFIQRFRIN